MPPERPQARKVENEAVPKNTLPLARKARPGTDVCPLDFAWSADRTGVGPDVRGHTSAPKRSATNPQTFGPERPATKAQTSDPKRSGTKAQTSGP